MTEVLEDIIPAPEEWTWIKVPNFAGGLNRDDETTALEDNEVPTANNVRVGRRGRMEIDKGYTTFGQVVRGTPRIASEFIRNNGTIELVLVTNLTFYKWNTTVLKWHYVSNGTSTTLGVAAALGAGSITVASATGFVNGSYIGIMLDSGAQHQTTVNGAPAGNVITLTDVLPSAAAMGNSVVEAELLTGTDGTPCDFVVHPGNDWFVFTNGLDTPRRYNGTSVEAITGFPGSSFAAYYCEVFADYLLFAHTIEDGAEKPNRVRRSDTADPTNWTTGNAGYDDLNETEDPIVGLWQNGPYLIAYKEVTVVRGNHINQVGKIFDWKSVVRKSGALGNFSVVETDEGHMVMTRTGVILYRGDFGVVPKADKIFDLVFSSEGELEPVNADTSWALYIPEYGELWFAYPGADQEFPNRLVRRDLVEDRWASRDLTNNMTFGTTYLRSQSINWENLTSVNWEDMDDAWNSRVFQQNSPTVLLLGASPCQVYEYNFVATQDNGTDLTYTIETKDFNFGSRLVRIDKIIASIKGNDVAISYSKDRGVTYTSIATVSPGSTFSKVDERKQFVTNEVRFKITGSGAPFAIEYLWFRAKVERGW